MTLEVILFRKKLKIVTYFCPFLLFAYLLPSPFNERPYNTLSVSEEGKMEYILRAKIWLSCLDSVFWQVLFEFLFVAFLLFFLAALKIE